MQARSGGPKVCGADVYLGLDQSEGWTAVVVCMETLKLKLFLVPLFGNKLELQVVHLHSYFLGIRCRGSKGWCRNAFIYLGAMDLAFCGMKPTLLCSEVQHVTVSPGA